MPMVVVKLYVRSGSRMTVRYRKVNGKIGGTVWSRESESDRVRGEGNFVDGNDGDSRNVRYDVMKQNYAVSRRFMTAPCGCSQW